MGEPRLKSSFIYLANAVNDLRDNWRSLALVLAPLVLLGALCLLPDALNLQHRLAAAFEPGAQNISLLPAQTPYAPSREGGPPLFPIWFTLTLHLLFLLITVAAGLVVLVALRGTDGRERGGMPEAIEVYRRAIAFAPAYAWVLLLQLIIPAVGIGLAILFASQSSSLFAALEFLGIVVTVFGWVLFLWLYFAPFALVFDGKHSWYALLFSRELMRKQFFRTAIRIVVFLAVWSGYNSWTSGAFVVVSLLIGPVGYYAGVLWIAIFFTDLLGVAVTYATNAFFIAAGARLYRDLTALLAERSAAAAQRALGPTVALTSSAHL
ncbi:MAG TPA: hypothetical protein VEC38_13040 [Candidatus Binataceae bacterium]|nr:hypothetical protein [Candidatus Binataceae bacterium]